MLDNKSVALQINCLRNQKKTSTQNKNVRGMPKQLAAKIMKMEKQKAIVSRAFSGGGKTNHYGK